jgi:hypothetical protein
MAKEVRYSFSFTGASALITETLAIAEEYRRLRDWRAVESVLYENNTLSKVKQSTFKREFSEIKKRLSTLTDEQLAIMLDGTLDDAKAIILLALVKTYSFLYDFIVDVLRNKYLLFDTTLTDIDYFKFFNLKSLTRSELNELTEITTKKVKQVIFKILEQVGLVTNLKTGSLIRPFLSEETIHAILVDDPSMLNAFLYSNEEIKGLLNKLRYA